MKLILAKCVKDYIMKDPEGEISWKKDKVYTFFKSNKNYIGFDEEWDRHYLIKKDFKSHFEVIDEVKIKDILQTLSRKDLY